MNSKSLVCGGVVEGEDRDPFMLQQQDQFVVIGIRSTHEVNPNTHFVVSKETRDNHNNMPRDQLA